MLAAFVFFMHPLYGLIGYPLTHSFSPAYFARKFAAEHIDAAYQAFPLTQIGELPQLLATHTNLRGLNVTIPYKQAVMPLLHGVDAGAAAVGAVNCIDIRDGKMTGYNTDVIGFRQSLIPLLQHGHTHALVLGTGGASRAVVYVLQQLGIPYLLVSRRQGSGNITYADVTADVIATHTLIVNTTPLGMYPHTAALPPLPYAAIGSGHLLYDLIYNPDITSFLAAGAAQGAATKNGFEMLELQAEASWDIWQ